MSATEAAAMPGAGAGLYMMGPRKHFERRRVFRGLTRIQLHPKYDSNVVIA
jgi:hypothetical protein